MSKPQVEEKVHSNFRIFMVIWVLLANVTLHAIGFHYGWVVFMSNAVFFLLPSKNYKRKLAEVIAGGMVGIFLCWLMLLCMLWLTPGLGGLLGHALPLLVVLALLIIGNAYAPLLLNNVGFVYLIACGMNSTDFLAHVPGYLLTMLLGGLVINGVCVLMMKPIRKFTINRMADQYVARERGFRDRRK